MVVQACSNNNNGSIPVRYITVRGSGTYVVHEGPRGGIYFINAGGEKQHLNTSQKQRITTLRDCRAAYSEANLETDDDDDDDEDDEASQEEATDDDDDEEEEEEEEEEDDSEEDDDSSQDDDDDGENEEENVEEATDNEEEEEGPDPDQSNNAEYIGVYPVQGRGEYDCYRGPRGGVFYINRSGNRTSLDAEQQDRIRAPQPQNATYIGMYPVQGRGDYQAYRGPRGGVFYVNSRGNRSFLDAGQQQKIRPPPAPQPNHRVGMYPVKGKGYCEVFRGPKGGLFYVNSNGNRSFLSNDQQRKIENR